MKSLSSIVTVKVPTPINAPFVAFIRSTTMISSPSMSISSTTSTESVTGAVAPAAKTTVVSVQVKSVPKVAVLAVALNITSTAAESPGVGFAIVTENAAVPTSSPTVAAEGLKDSVVGTIGGQGSILCIPRESKVLLGKTIH